MKEGEAVKMFGVYSVVYCRCFHSDGTLMCEHPQSWKFSVISPNRREGHYYKNNKTQVVITR